MDNKEIIKELDEAIKLNREARTKNNDAMCHAQNALARVVNADSDSYKQGLEDAYKLIKRLHFDETLPENLHDLFPIYDRSLTGIPNILKQYDIHEIKEKLEAYDGERNKPKLGDVVKCGSLVSNATLIGILSNENERTYSVILKGKSGVTYQDLYKDCWTIEKTGKHFDIQSMLDEIG